MSSLLSRKYVYLLNLILVIALVFGLADTLKSKQNGQVGKTSAGCYTGNCHGTNSSSAATTIGITSGTSFAVAPNGSLNLTVRVSHATLLYGGFDAAVFNASSGGTLVGTLSSPGSGAKLSGSEVMHSTPKLFSSGGCDFTFTWTAPATPGTYYLQVAGIAVNHDGTENSADIWNLATQAITVGSSGSIVVSAPNGGESVCQGASTPISWTSTGVTNVKIEMSSDGGSTYPTVLSASFPAASGNFPWTVPTSQQANGLNKIRISDASNSAIVDESNSNFTVNAITAVSVQPQAATACIGSPATLWVSAIGANLTYQWKKNGINVGSATSNTLTIPSVLATDGGSYSCEVTGGCGPVANSSSAILTVKTPPSIVTQPVGKSVCIGSPAVIFASADGDNLTYKWQKDGVDVPNATSATLTIPFFQILDAGSYKFVATSSFCNITVQSTAAILTSGIPPSIKTQPINTNVCENGTATLFLECIGTNMTFQWYQNGVQLSNTNSSTLSIPNVLVARSGKYYCKISGSCDPATTSSTVTLNINNAPVISLNPLSKNIAEGGSVTFTVGSSTTAIPITYQWYKGATLLTGQTNSSLVLSNLTINDNGDYNCKLTNDCGTTTSGVATLTVTSAGNGILNLASNSVVFGEVLQNKPEEKILTDFLSNTGKKALKITAVTLKGSEKANFAIKGLTLPVTIDAGKTQSISVVFTPGTRGLNTAVADFVTEDNQTLSLGLVGKSSIDKAGLTLNNNNFNVNAKINQSVSTTLTLTNNTSFPETVSSINVSDNNFTVSSPSGTFTLDANKSKDIVVTFNPKVAGTYSCTVSIKADYAISTLKAYLTSVVNSSVEYEEDLISNMNVVPNPIDGNSEISFVIPTLQSFEFRIIDAQGRTVRLFDEPLLVSGNYSIKWDGTDNNNIPLSSGVYYGIYKSSNKIKTINLNIKR